MYEAISSKVQITLVPSGNDIIWGVAKVRDPVFQLESHLQSMQTEFWFVSFVSQTTKLAVLPCVTPWTAAWMRNGVIIIATRCLNLSLVCIIELFYQSILFSQSMKCNLCCWDTIKYRYRYRHRHSHSHSHSQSHSQRHSHRHTDTQTHTQIFT